MRILIPLIAIALGVAAALGVYFNNTGPPATAPVAASAPAQTSPADVLGPLGASDTEAAAGSTRAAAVDAGPAGEGSQAEASGPGPGSPPAAASAAPAPAAGALPAIPGLGVDAAAPSPDVTLGGLGADDRLEVTLGTYGAGIRRIQLADYAQTIQGSDPYLLLDADKQTGVAGGGPLFYPYAARAITINGTAVRLDNQAFAADAPVRTAARTSVTYRLRLVDAGGAPVGEVVRTWTLPTGSYDLALDQRFVNTSGRPLKISLLQYGQGDLLVDEGAYVGDRRMFVTGYFRPELPAKTGIYVDEGQWMHTALVNSVNPPDQPLPDAIWPNDDTQAGSTLAWIAAENRYFAVVTHAPVPTVGSGRNGEPVTADVPALQDAFPRMLLELKDPTGAPRADPNVASVAITLGTAELDVAPGGEASMPLAIFAGPRKEELLEEPVYAALHLEKLIRYELGCTLCTFQFLAHGLLDYLRLLHSVVGDWGVAIILLVLTVRLILHPITKKAQINMMKMGRQMAAIQPEMAKIKEKFKDDSAKMNAEVMKLYKEKGVNPAGILGCAPMLLQTPIWIALYAMLYYAIELRHEPAFYGVFQAVSGGNWKFLADLSVADHFIDIPGSGFGIPLPFVDVKLFDYLNILPILMAFIFAINMKFTTPPPATPEQAQQQKIMRIMPFIFPIFLYSAPSGLTLYICCSTLAGIVDSWIVRRHVKAQEDAGTLFDKKEVKPGSLRWKLQQRMAMAQELAAKRMEEGGSPFGGPAGGAKSPGKKTVQNFKERKKK